MRRYKRGSYKRAFLLAVFCLLCILHVERVSASGNGAFGELPPGSVVKVGYTKNDPMIRRLADGGFVGYGVEYLDKIAEITGWSYEYVLVTEENRLEELQKGGVDLLCNVPKSGMEDSGCCFSQNPCGLEHAMLCAKEGDNTVFFEDYADMDGRRIGINQNLYMEDILKGYAAEHGFSYEPVYFTNYQDTAAAVLDGTVDMMLTSSLRNTEEFKYVAKPGMQDVYFAASKDRAGIMASIDGADGKLKLNAPFFISGLYEKYYGRPSVMLTGITKEEYEYIQAGGEIRVAYDTDRYPIEYCDGKTGEYRGVYADVLRMIEEKSGLNFTYVPVGKEENAWQMLMSGEVDMIAGDYGSAETASLYGISFTAPYLEVEYALVCRENDIDLDNLCISLNERFVGVQNYFREHRPKWKIKLYPNTDECLKAAENGEVDAAVVNTIFLQTAYSLGAYKDLKILPTQSMLVGICMAVGANEPPLIKSIVDKSIYKIPAQDFEKCVVENTVYTSYTPSLKDLFLKLMPYISVLAAALFFLFFCFIKSRELHYKHLAMSDPITGLWNGAKFREEAKSLLRSGKKQEYCIVSLDIDKFKFVNNDFGTASADEVLKTVGERLKESFTPGGIVARDMADMFLVLTPAGADNALVEKLFRTADDIYFNASSGRQRYKPSIKFGVYHIASQTVPEGEISGLIDKAIVARKSIKNASGTGVAFYDAKLGLAIENELQVERKMEGALEAGEFAVYFQPKFDLGTERITGAEALVRWIDPDKGIVPPDSFIPIFEKNGFIVKLDFYVFEEVLRLMQKWNGEKRMPLCISVNVSRVHINSPDFLKKLSGLVDRYGVERNKIELELTETILGSKKENILHFIRACKDAGFMVSIDDFGSGYSSLNLLKELPVDVLKIDKGFLDETGESERSRIIVGQVVEMARKIKIGTICEGVETREQAEFLKEIGCDMAQGYLFSRPVPSAEFERMI